jgi:pectinesterase
MIGRAFFLAALVALAATRPGLGQGAPKSAKPVTVFLAGDSTMATQAVVPATPGRGWGQMLQPYFQDHVRVVNHASSGQSSKSFRDKGLWKRLLAGIKPCDFVIIQFGHNDSKPDKGRHTDPFGSFSDNLKRFVQEVRDRKATPILATPIVRNVWSADGKTLRDTHGDYVVAARKVAKGQKVPLLDLTKKTGGLLVKLGPERSKLLFNNVGPGEFAKYPDGFKDGTHLNCAGACRVCDLAIEEILANVPELAKAVRRGPPRARSK